MTSSFLFRRFFFRYCQPTGRHARSPLPRLRRQHFHVMSLCEFGDLESASHFDPAYGRASCEGRGVSALAEGSPSRHSAARFAGGPFAMNSKTVKRACIPFSLCFFGSAQLSKDNYVSTILLGEAAPSTLRSSFLPASPPLVMADKSPCRILI